MKTKKNYSIGDTAWIYGIGNNNKLTKGKIIKVVDLNDAGWVIGPHYIIEIPTHIEPLLEIRTWETISQDEQGPVGMFREVTENLDSTHKMISRTGFSYDNENTPDSEEPSDEQIYAALEQSIHNSVHRPLILKDKSTPRRRPLRKKK